MTSSIVSFSSFRAAAKESSPTGPPENLLITAETKNKTIMGLMHKYYDIHGFQFHPESISTKVGMKLIKNFITN